MFFIPSWRFKFQLPLALFIVQDTVINLFLLSENVFILFHSWRIFLLNQEFWVCTYFYFKTLNALFGFLVVFCVCVWWEFSRSVLSDSLRPHEPQHIRPPCPSLTPGAYSNPCPSSRWCHPAVSSSVIPFSSCPQLFPASGSFQMNQLLTSGGQSIGVSASTSVLPMNTQDWSPLGWTGWISLQSKGLSRVFSNTIVQKHQFFGVQLSL